MLVVVQSNREDFNPRSHERSDLFQYIDDRINADFNPRSHERSDTVLDLDKAFVMYISIHAPTRGATDTMGPSEIANRYFNPRSHERSDRKSASMSDWLEKFQSTLPREERHQQRRRFGARQTISIHAPTRGATRVPGKPEAGSDRISIHAPTRGATTLINASPDQVQFQSTLPREERPSWCRYFPLLRYFNPRSHERSDDRRPPLFNIQRYFNPRSHERSDGTLGALTTVAIFQSTLPREERRRPWTDHQTVSDFNPRSHERSDEVTGVIIFTHRIFQSTLPREERRMR